MDQTELVNRADNKSTSRPNKVIKSSSPFFLMTLIRQTSMMEPQRNSESLFKDKRGESAIDIDEDEEVALKRYGWFVFCSKSNFFA